MVAARTSQADTVQYKKNEQYNTQKKISNTEQYDITEQYKKNEYTTEKNQSISRNASRPALMLTQPPT
jgi:hypothetical protein